MKRIISILILLSALLAAPAAHAQKIAMDEAYLTFEYPEEWLIVSPQLAKVYAPLLQEAGMDAEELSAQLEENGVLTRAYNPSFTQQMSVLTKQDTLSMEIFDIARVTDEQRKEMRAMAEKGRFWETTGLRAQDVEWQKEGGAYWLYIHYTRVFGDQITGRGLRYVTVKNGMYVMLDWQIDNGRFSNKNLRDFRARTHDLKVTRQLEIPQMNVRLNAQLPSETNTADFTVTGKATAGAAIVLEAPDAMGTMHSLAVGEAGPNGSFTLDVQLEEEGVYDLLLTAIADGMTDTSISGTLTYSAKTLPVSLSGIEEGGVLTVTKNKMTISGTTLAGVQMQLVSPLGLTKKTAGKNGSFSFDVTTKEEGEYKYTLILNKSGFNQRRVPFTLVRVMTDDEERAAVRATAEKINYKTLQRDLSENHGKVMSLYGPVTQVSDAGSVQYIRMQFNKGADNTWYNPVIVVAREDTGAKEGDMITLVAKVSGVFEEQDANGDPVMVPSFDLVFVDKVE